MTKKSEKTTGTPSLDDLRNVVTIYTDMVIMEKEKKKTASVPYADRVANRTPEGELRRGTTTYRTPDARTAILRLFNSIDIAELGDDLVINTLKYSGSRANRLKLAPNDESANVHIERFDFFFSDLLGAPAKFLWFKDFNEVGGGLHFHVLISRPADIEAASFDRMVRSAWARATGQEFDRSGVNAWTPKVTEVWYGETATKTFKNFVRYEAYKYNPEIAKFEKKIAQKRVDIAWLESDNYRVRWAGISTALLPTEPLKLTLTCACGNTDVRAVMQEHSPAARHIVRFDCREVEGETVEVDLGRWSYDLTGKGCTEFIKVTPELIEALRAVEEAHADCSAPAPVEEVTVAPVAVEEAPSAPSATEQVSIPAEAFPASSEFVTITKDSPMKEVHNAFRSIIGSPDMKFTEAAMNLAVAEGTSSAPTVSTPAGPSTITKESIMNTNSPTQSLDATVFEKNSYLFLLKLNTILQHSTINEAPLHDLLVATSKLAEDGVEEYSVPERKMLCNAVDALAERFRYSFEDGDLPWGDTSAHDPWEDPQLVAAHIFGAIVELEERREEEAAAYAEVLANRNAVKALLRQSRIEAGAERVGVRFEPLVPHLALVAPVVADEFAALSPMDQFDELLAPVPVVEIPRIASEPDIRRPRFIAGLANRTAADLAFLAAYVRIEQSMDSMIADEISIDDYVAVYVAEKALIDELVESGKMTAMPLDFSRGDNVPVL